MKKSVRKQRKSLRNKRRNTKKHSRKTRVNTKKGGMPWTDPCVVATYAKNIRGKDYSYNINSKEIQNNVGTLEQASVYTPDEYANKVSACKNKLAKKEEKNQPVIFTLPLASE